MPSPSVTRTDPKLWNRIVAKVKRGAKGGDPGEWSARKAQLAVAEYKKAGGGYEGPKPRGNHLSEWTREDWGTKSGARSKDTGERYLPRQARKAVTDEEYARSTAKKRADTAKGHQHSRQPADVAKKTAAARKSAPARASAGQGQVAKRASTRRAVPKAAARDRPAAREVSAIRRDFRAAVNMSASVLERHLRTRRSYEVGFKRGGRGESVGHEMGSHIVELLRRKDKEDFSPEDEARMRKVVGFVRRHLAQRPAGDVRDTDWAVSLKNWGHDPLKD